MTKVKVNLCLGSSGKYMSTLEVPQDQTEEWGLMLQSCGFVFEPVANVYVRPWKTDVAQYPTSEEAVPAYTKEAIDGWVDGSRPYPGDFVYAALAGDLNKAAMHADATNTKALAAIAKYIYNHVPVAARGENMQAWQAKRLQERGNGGC